MLTSDECARIVHASIDPSRILAGIDGYNGSPPDVLLTVVAKIKADAVAAARAEVLGIARLAEHLADSGRLLRCEMVAFLGEERRDDPCP